MMLGAKLPDLTATDGTVFETYHHCIAQVMCNPPLPECYLDTCPGIGTLKESLLAVLDDNMIDSVTYKQWTTVDI